MTKTCNSIVLLGNGFTNWGGGIDFLRFCANALSLVCHQNTKIIILLPDPRKRPFIAKLRSFASPYKQMAIALLKGKTPVFLSRKPFTIKQLSDSFNNIDGCVEILFYDPRKQVQSIFTNLHADVIIPSAYSLGALFPVPWVGYVYDFQHKYYPDYFSNDEIYERDVRLSRMLSDASAVIVNAADVKKDILKFYPQTKCNIFNLPFSATPIASWFKPSSENLVQKYNLPKKYFIICNQFWIHKDHATAFKALAKYSKTTGQHDVHIVCTGSTTDSRHPEYFSSLKYIISELKLTTKVHFLGHIPKKDQIDIMRGSIAVLQPTLFEGGPGGGAVYDAISVGVPAIISSIPVNREIEGYKGVYYFQSTNASDLATKMISVQSIRHDHQKDVELSAAGRERTLAFGLRLLDAIEFVIKHNTN